MVENRPFIDQFHELQRMHAHMKIREIKTNEVLIISRIIDKLPPSWRDVRQKHKRGEITLSDLGQHIVFESSIRIKGKLEDGNSNVGKINMVAEGKPSHSGKRERKMHLSRGRLITLPTTPVKKQVGSVASLDTKRKITLFSRTSKRRKMIFKTLLIKVIM